MNKSRVFLPALAAFVATVFLCVASATASVLLTDDFDAATLDDAKYALAGGAIGNVQQTDGELVLAGGAEWFPRIGSQGTLPDNILIETDIRIVDPAPASGTWEANTGIRASGAGFDSTGLTAEIFTTFQGNASPHKLIIRRGGDWVVFGQTDLSADLVADQVVTLSVLIHIGANTATATVIDKATATQLATLTVAPSGIPVGGTFMLQSYNMTGSAFQSFTATAEGGAGAVVFEDDFGTPIIDGEKWHSYPVNAAFAYATGSAVRLSGDDPLNLYGDFAWLPTKALFDDFDLQAVFNLADLNNDTGELSAGGSFGVQFRVTNTADGYYSVAVWPNPGAGNLYGSGVSSPAVALLKGTGSGTYEFVAGPRSIAPLEVGSTVVVNLRVADDSIEAFLGEDTLVGVLPVLRGEDETNFNGVVNFFSFGIVGIELDEYTIWAAGTGELPETPQPPAAAGAVWSLYR